MHFGGSHQQATLHTGDLYVSQNDPTTFCTLSDCHLKDPVAIWAYLDPLLDKLHTDFPSVNQVHFFSDGPTTQYRQKRKMFICFQVNFSVMDLRVPLGIFLKQRMAKALQTVLVL